MIVNTKPRSSIGFAATYPFPDMTHERVAEHGVQYLSWGFSHAHISMGLGHN